MMTRESDLVIYKELINKKFLSSTPLLQANYLETFTLLYLKMN